MQHSLKSVLILGQPSTSIPKGMLKYFHILSNKIKQKTTEKIGWYLDNLEGLIKFNLQGIINITMEDHDVSGSKVVSDQTDIGYSDYALNLLNEFKRQSQTAVALKILLQQRGVYTAGANFKESVQQIEGHIERLKKKEENQKKQLTTYISEMHSDLSHMLKNDQYSDEMKKVVRKVMTNLEGDQKAIEQGGNLDELQLSFEIVETGEERKKDPVEVQKQVVTETEEYLEELDQTDKVKTISTKSGFLATLLRWLNTPWNVSWRDITKRNTKRNKK
jgi:hypothetical protein